MARKTSKQSTKVSKTPASVVSSKTNKKLKTPTDALPELDDHLDDTAHPAANIDPEEKDIAELLTKPQKPKKIEKVDIDKWLIDREIESAENGTDWY